jgi:hypothetical protein
MLHLKHSFIWCWNLDASGSRSETPGKFWKVVLEKDGKDHLDRSCEKWSIIESQEAEEFPAWKSKRKANLIGHIVRRNCHLQWFIEGKLKGGIEVTGRRGRRRRKLLDDLKERRGYSHLKEEALDRTMWRACIGRGFGPAVRQTAKWMKLLIFYRFAVKTETNFSVPCWQKPVSSVITNHVTTLYHLRSRLIFSCQISLKCWD